MAFDELISHFLRRRIAFAFFFRTVGVGRNEAVALSVLGGLLMLLWSLLGGIYFLLGRTTGEIPAEFADPDKALAEIEADGAPAFAPEEPV